jgi:hypothetical protein
MSSSIPEGNREIVSTSPTPEFVLSSNVARNGAQDVLSSIEHPAFRANVIDPTRDRVIRCTLKRAAGRIALKILLRQLFLEFEYLALKTRYSYLRSVRKIVSNTVKFRLD